MTTMNGAALPYTITAGSLSLQVTHDVLVLNADGSYADSTTFAIPNGKALQTSISIERGSFRYGSDGSIIFSNATSGGTSYAGRIAGTTLTESVHGTTPVYERR